MGKNGKASMKVLILRNTEPALVSTTIRTWTKWFPEEIFGAIKWDTPITHHFTWCDVNQNKKIIDLEVIFLALESYRDIFKVKSFDATIAWWNEGSECPEKIIIDEIEARCHRYPPMDDKPDNVPIEDWYPNLRILIDTNSFSSSHWLYTLFEKTLIEDPSISAEIFKQPSGLSPEAENLPNLEKGYYTDRAKGKEQWWVDMYIHNKYGYSREGKPVYSNYNDSKHVAKNEIFANKNLPVVIGMDFGHNCAAIFTQIDSMGRLNVIDELISNMAIREFLITMLKPFINSKYFGCKILVVGDPSGWNRERDDGCCGEELTKAHIPNQRAPSQDPVRRQGALNTLLTTMVTGELKFQMNQRCITLREGFNSGYMFKKVMKSGSTEYTEEPDKNRFSHCMEGLEYAALYYEETALNSTRPVIIQKKVPKIAWF
ncbi:MAG: hypothetical protein NUV76_12275 [Candidatus Kuenenia sp.]|nr:hypothetical protein [Candidatus Kuenenia sp.]